MMRKIAMLNKQHKNGSWSLSADYLVYRREGGGMSPEAWNYRVKELRKEKA